MTEQIDRWQLNQPLAFERMLSRLALDKYAGYEVLGVHSFLMVAPLSPPRLVEVSYEPPPVGPTLELRLPQPASAPVSASDRQQLRSLLTHVLSLDVDLAPFYDAFDAHPQLGPLTQAFRGLRFVRDRSLFECTVRTIIGQQLNMSFAGTLVGRLVELAGEPLATGHILFPSPEAIASLTYNQLRDLQFSQRKAEYVIDFARLVASGSMDLDALAQSSDEDFTEKLTAIRGIGRWTAECVLMFGLGRPDLFPAADIGLRNAVQRVYMLDHQPTAREIRHLGEEWRPWRSYATLYLWEFLQD